MEEELVVQVKNFANYSFSNPKPTKNINKKFYCMLFKNKKISLLHKKNNIFDLAWGFLDSQEKIEENVIREILIRYKIVICDILAVGFFYSPNKKEKTILLFAQIYEGINNNIDMFRSFSLRDIRHDNMKLSKRLQSTSDLLEKFKLINFYV